MGGAVRSGVSEVVVRSKSLSRGTPPPSAASRSEIDGGGGTGTPTKKGFLGRWGSLSRINTKKRERDQHDSSSLGGGRESPSPSAEPRRSHTMERTSRRSDKIPSSPGTPPPASSPTGKVIFSRPSKDSTKGIVGGVIGRVWKLDITPETSVTSLKDKPSGRPCKICIINTPTARPIVLAAQDHKSKARLLAALQEAILHCQDPLPYQLRMSLNRRREEEEERLRESQEHVRRSSQADLIEQTQAELAAERTAKEEAQSLAQSEATARAAEEERVHELTALRTQLEALLEQETQAKRDEEIVRNLQARVLREEWAKREELERLQQEQQHLLEEEQRKRIAFEKLQQEQEKKLREAEARLKSLDSDRRRLDEELRSAREKIVMSGRGKQLLEAKMKVQEGRRPPSRTLSLRPSRQERSSPARSSSFTTPPDHRLPTSSSEPPRNTAGLNSSPRPPASLTFHPPAPSTPGHSTSSTPTTSPAGGLADRTFEMSISSERMNGGSPSTPRTTITTTPTLHYIAPTTPTLHYIAPTTPTSHPSTIPEQEEVESVGWRGTAEDSISGVDGQQGAAAADQDGCGEEGAAEDATGERQDSEARKFKEKNVEKGINESVVECEPPPLLPSSALVENECDNNEFNEDDRYIEIKTYEEKSVSPPSVETDDDGDNEAVSPLPSVTKTTVVTTVTTAGGDWSDDLMKVLVGGLNDNDSDAPGGKTSTVVKETVTTMYTEAGELPGENLVQVTEPKTVTHATE